MALYTYEINSDWLFTEDPDLPGLWYAIKHVKFEDDTTYHTQTNYYRVSIFKQYGKTLYSTVRDLNGTGTNSSTDIAIPYDFDRWNLRTSWHLPNLSGDTIYVEGLGDVNCAAGYNSFYYVEFGGTTLPKQSAPEGFTGFTNAIYFLHDAEVIAKCNSTLTGAGQLGIEVHTMYRHAKDKTQVITSGSYFVNEGLYSSGSENERIDAYYPLVKNGTYSGNARIIYAPYKCNRGPTAVSSSVNLTTGEVKITFSVKPLSANGFKVWVGSQISDLNVTYPYRYSPWLEDGREVPAEFFEGSSSTFSFTLTEAERFTLFELADEFGLLDTSTGHIQMKIIWYVYTGFYPPEDVTDVEFTYVAERASSNYVNLVGRIPNVEGEVYDVNEKTLALTGDKDTLVRYHSTAHFDIRGEALDAATLQELSVSNAGGIIAGESGEFNNVESNIFYLNAIDSRGNTNRVEVVKGWIEYVKLTANIKSNEVSADGFASITISGNYYGGSFGAQDNSLTLSVRYKTGDGEYGDWVSITPTIGGSNTYEHTINLEGLDYMETYTFQAKAVDKLEEILSAEKVFTTIPVFDWGHDDFNFNVPVTIQGKRMGENTILWNGSSAMIATDRAELSEPISAQMNGIVLVFSAASGDVSWNMQYVPKVMVNLLNGGGMAFMMAPNAAMGKFGAKYLYISDDVIEGDVSNETAGTGASAIKFTNADFVLRYVIGV